MRQLPHPEVVDDQERHGGEIGEQHLPGAIDRGLRDLFDEQVGFTINDARALLDGGPADRLREMAFARPWWSEKQGVLALLDEARGVPDLVALPVESESKEAA